MPPSPNAATQAPVPLADLAERLNPREVHALHHALNVTEMWSLVTGARLIGARAARTHKPGDPIEIAFLISSPEVLYHSKGETLVNQRLSEHPGALRAHVVMLNRARFDGFQHGGLQIGDAIKQGTDIYALLAHARMRRGPAYYRAIEGDYTAWASGA